MAVATGTRVDVERFREEGYLVLEDVLDVERDLDPVVAEYTEKLDELARAWHAEGKLQSTYADLPFVQRLAQVLTETGRAGYQSLDISLPFANVTEETPIHLGPATFGLLTSPRLIDAVEQMVGPEVLSNPIQHVRIKPPERLLPAGVRAQLAGGADGLAPGPGRRAARGGRDGDAHRLVPDHRRHGRERLPLRRPATATAAAW